MSFAFVFLLTAVAALAIASAASGVRAMATHLPVYIFAKNVAKNIAKGAASVSLLVPPGTDAHEFQMRPDDLKRLGESDVVFLSGAGLDDGIRDRISGKIKAHFVDTSKGAGLIYHGGTPDPHIWLDPSLAAIQVKNIAHTLAEKDPENKGLYEKNSVDYISKLMALDGRIEKALAPFMGKYLITYHEAFDYFGKRYGLRTFSLTGPNAEAPLPRRMKEAYDIVKREGVKAIFVEKQFPRDAGERLGRELGVRVCAIDTIESGHAEAGFYEEAMAENADTIAQCLGGANKGRAKE